MTPPPINRHMSPVEWGLLVFLAIVWGGSYFYVGIAVKELPPLTIVAVRVILGAALLYLVARAAGARLPRAASIWGSFFVMGLLNNVIPFSLIAWSQGHVESGLAAILNATTPLFTVIVAHFMTHDEKMTPARVAGLVVGFAGVVVMIGPDALAGAGSDLLAELAPLLASVFYAVSGVYGRRFSRLGLKPIATATSQVTASAVMMLPLALVFDAPWTLPAPSFNVVLALIGLAALSTTLGYVLFYRILASAGAVNLLLVTFLVPVSAIILGALILDEHLALNHFAGMALIGLGLAGIDGRVFNLLWRKAA
ncbi:MAG TPA: DMT family transporter [Bauldia sp.]|nr:DMT family transporter [Bauldia sp.]